MTAVFTLPLRRLAGTDMALDLEERGYDWIEKEVFSEMEAV